MAKKGKGKGKGGKYRTAAKMMINGPGAMTMRGRRDIAQWLRKQAGDLLRRGDQYTEGRFTHSFLYVD